MRTIPAEHRPQIAMLIYAAEIKHMPTYTQFGRTINNSARGHGRKRIEPINAWCRANDVPMLGSIVVLTGKDIPELEGFTGPKYQALYPGWDEKRVREEQQRCFAFDWKTWLKGDDADDQA